MATKLGECSIEIAGSIVSGTFKSVYEKNVYSASPQWGAKLLHDAFSKLTALAADEKKLVKSIKAVTFTSPNKASTKFTIEVKDAKVLAGLVAGKWDSYYLG